MGTDISIGMGSLGDAAALAGDGEHAVNSMEQVYSPIEINKGPPASAVLSEFLRPTKSPDAVGQNLQAEEESGPFGVLSSESGDGQVGPTRDELDPYFSRILGDDGTDWIAETYFQMMVNDGEGVNGGRELNLRKTKDRREITKVQVGSAFRGPLIMSGFGYDIADRPAPYVDKNNVNTFHAGVVSDTTIWKTGPVNLQWDDERMVWQGGPQILCGVVLGAIKAPLSPCDPTDFIVQLFRKGNTTNSFHHKISACELDQTITVQNRDPSLTQEAVKGMIWCVAVRINYEWIPLWVGCPEGPPPECGEEGYPECANCDDCDEDDEST